MPFTSNGYRWPRAQRLEDAGNRHPKPKPVLAHWQVIMLACLLALSLSGCNLPQTPVASPLPPSPIAAAATSLTPPALTLEQALNTTYRLMSNDGGQMDYPLQNGSYQNGSDPTAVGYATVFVLRDQIALGDINGDGAGDAVVPVGLNFGGTGQFIFLAALINQNGQAVQTASATYGLGDRPQVQSLTIENGKINLQAIVASPNDPACCGTLPLTLRLEYNDRGYRLLHLTTGLPNSGTREVTISRPVSEAVVGPQVTIEGQTSVGPFENTLIYHIYGADGMAVTEAGFTVQNEEVGQPATFSLPLNLAALGLHGRIRVEIAEMSMADGSTLMLDSIYLNTP